MATKRLMINIMIKNPSTFLRQIKALYLAVYADYNSINSRILKMRLSGFGVSI